MLLVGLLANLLLGWSWADPVAALVIAVIAVKEGRDAWQGKGCCTPTTHVPAEHRSSLRLRQVSRLLLTMDPEGGPGTPSCPCDTWCAPNPRRRITTPLKGLQNLQRQVSRRTKRCGRSRRSAKDSRSASGPGSARTGLAGGADLRRREDIDTGLARRAERLDRHRSADPENAGGRPPGRSGSTCRRHRRHHCRGHVPWPDHHTVNLFAPSVGVANKVRVRPGGCA
ncbi:hypothetical protein HDC93_003427 [Streptomyces sp. AK010]|nr:hypothetical protein [Streptomyces sp. AK010]